MWSYEKKLQYPVRIKTPNAKLAKITKICGTIFFVVTLVVCVLSARL